MHECAINRRNNLKDIIKKRQQYVESIQDIEEMEIKLHELKVDTSYIITNDGEVNIGPIGGSQELLQLLQALKKIRYDAIFNSQGD